MIVTGADRAEALERARRALDEIVVEGVPTVLPFDRAVVRDPAFVAADGDFRVHTRWIETEFDNRLEPYAPAETTAEAGPGGSGERREIVAEVNGRRVVVSLPAELVAPPTTGAATSARVRRSARGHAAPSRAGGAVVAPMQGTVVKVAVAAGDAVSAGDVVVVVEAMKMENPITAPGDGVVASVDVAVGDPVTVGATVAVIEPGTPSGC